MTGKPARVRRWITPVARSPAPLTTTRGPCGIGTFSAISVLHLINIRRVVRYGGQQMPDIHFRFTLFCHKATLSAPWRDHSVPAYVAQRVRDLLASVRHRHDQFVAPG